MSHLRASMSPRRYETDSSTSKLVMIDTVMYCDCDCLRSYKLQFYKAFTFDVVGAAPLEKQIFADNLGAVFSSNSFFLVVPDDPCSEESHIKIFF